jgi:hypothetical protein
MPAHQYSEFSIQMLLLFLLTHTETLDIPRPEHWKFYAGYADCGSSSTRLSVCAWNSTEGIAKGEHVFHAPMTWRKRINVSLATASKDKTVIPNFVRQIISILETIIPEELLETTLIHILGTAGMRALPEEEQKRIMQELSDCLSKNSRLKVDPKNIRVITGAEEAILAWTAVNYLFRNFADGKETLPILEIGGVSSQICCQVTKGFPNATKVKIGKKKYYVVAYSFHGCGVDAALDNITDSLDTARAGGQKLVGHPCYPLGYSFEHKGAKFTGTGDANRCVKLFRKILLNSTKCNDIAPEVLKLLKNKRVVALSYCFYVNGFFHLPNNSSLSDLLQKTTKFCNTTWNESQWKSSELQYVKGHCGGGVYVWTLEYHGLGFRDGRPMTIKVNEIEGVDGSWTTGAMVHYAPGSEEEGLDWMTTTGFMTLHFQQSEEGVDVTLPATMPGRGRGIKAILVWTLWWLIIVMLAFVGICLLKPFLQHEEQKKLN